MTTATFTSAPITKPEFFVGGKAVFTIAIPGDFVASHPECKDHYTFKIVHKAANAQWPECYMVLMLTGPDTYRYAGKLEKWQLKTTAKSCVKNDSWAKLIFDKIMLCAAANELHKIRGVGWELMHEGRCCVCGRRLTVPESIEAGIGPECAGRVA